MPPLRPFEGFGINILPDLDAFAFQLVVQCLVEVRLPSPPSALPNAIVEKLNFEKEAALVWGCFSAACVDETDEGQLLLIIETGPHVVSDLPGIDCGDLLLFKVILGISRKSLRSHIKRLNSPL